MCLLHNSLRSPRRSVSPKMDSNRNQITFVFLSSANILGVLRLGFFFFFLFAFFLLLFFLNRPLLQIVDLEKILHAGPEPGKFSLSSSLDLFLWCTERLIGFADGLSPP